MLAILATVAVVQSWFKCVTNPAYNVSNTCVNLQGARAGCCASGPLKGHRKRLSNLMPNPLVAHACGRHADCIAPCGRNSERHRAPGSTSKRGTPPDSSAELEPKWQTPKGPIEPKNNSELRQKGPFQEGEAQGGPGPPRRSKPQGGGGRPPSPPARPRGQLVTNKIPFTSSF